MSPFEAGLKKIAASLPARKIVAGDVVIEPTAVATETLAAVASCVRSA
jgi:hypothetical protein